MKIRYPEPENIADFRFFNLAGFNWIFERGVHAADNNQQIVEAIAARFSQHSGLQLDTVRAALDNFKNPAPEEPVLLLYTQSGTAGVHACFTCKNSALHQQLTPIEIA